MYEVKEVTLSELDIVVSIHNSAFPDFFLTLLGEHFLKVYYRAVLKHDDGILLGCYDDDHLIGFCAATMIAKDFNVKLIKSDLFSFMKIGVSLLFTNRIALKRLYLNLSKNDSGNHKDTGEYAELLSIGVGASYQGKGVGKHLLTGLEKYISQKGGHRLSLTTDFYDNQKAIGFYRSMGYRPFYDFITYPNRKMYRLIKSLI
ncbi:GNAT family N-acetyltransferase [Bacteroides sp.]